MHRTARALAVLATFAVLGLLLLSQQQARLVRLRSQTAPPPDSAASATVARPEPPDHSMLFGYFYADGRYGDHAADVGPYSDAYVACPGCFDTASDWRPPLRTAIDAAVSRGETVVAITGEPADWDAMLDLLAPQWTHVAFVEVAHEAKIGRRAMDARVRDWRRRVAMRGLSSKPVGAMQALCQTWDLWRCVWWNGWTSAELDMVGFEAYPPIPNVDAPPGGLPFAIDYDAAHITANLAATLTHAAARLAPQQRIYLATMAYDRNGQWRDPSSLATIQRATYDWARSRSRVVALLPFAYARPGGALDHPDMKDALEQIGLAIRAR